MKLKFILIVVLVVVAIFVVYKSFFGEKELPYDWITLQRQNIVQKVSATGQVTSAKKIELQFEIAGKISKIIVDTGDEVKAGDVLATLETSELETQVSEAEAARDVAKANLNKLLTGASKEEIQVYQTAVDNSRIALDNAEISLKNSENNLAIVQATAQQNLVSAYEDALNILDDSYLKIYNALQTVKTIQLTYFIKVDQESVTVIENKNKIEADFDQAKIYVNKAKTDPKNENIDEALSEVKKSLEDTFSALTIIRQTCEAVSYRGVISNTDKTSLDTQRTNISTALTEITNGQQTIFSTKLTNETNINTAQTSVDTAQSAVKTAEGNLKSAQDKLAQITAPPRQIDIELEQAKVNQAEASLMQAKQQLTKAIIKSPCDGQITDIAKEQGEQVRVTDTVVAMICKGNFQIEVDIPEIDIGKVKIQNPVEISIDAFPEDKFLGKVIKIDPAETIIQGVVYYKATVNFEVFDPRIKSGMSADVDIICDSRENALAVPSKAIFSKDGDKFVRILEGKNVKEIKVETGIRGSEGEIEILSGLKEGEKVITFIKK
jgi:HlyD family secretion protein